MSVPTCYTSWRLFWYACLFTRLLPVNRWCRRMLHDWMDIFLCMLVEPLSPSFCLPRSLQKDPQTSKILFSLNILHSFYNRMNELWEQLITNQSMIYAMSIHVPSTDVGRHFGCSFLIGCVFNIYIARVRCRLNEDAGFRMIHDKVEYSQYVTLRSKG